MPEPDPAATVTSLQAGDVATVVPIVTVMAKAYTRGRGFEDGEPNEELAAVIATASARLAGNPTGLAAKRIDDVEYRYSLASTFAWTLAEQAVLNRYRVTAM
ncbi:MAG: hypothetical protein KDB50_10040 [Mycobacterium sp.]|nr:hypothetical protein [Mycobacterium sp.]